MVGLAETSKEKSGSGEPTLKCYHTQTKPQTDSTTKLNIASFASEGIIINVSDKESKYNQQCLTISNSNTLQAPKLDYLVL